MLSIDLVGDISKRGSPLLKCRLPKVYPDLAILQQRDLDSDLWAKSPLPGWIPPILRIPKGRKPEGLWGDCQCLTRKCSGSVPSAHLAVFQFDLLPNRADLL